MIACRNLGQPTVNSPIPCSILYYHPYTTSRPKETKDLRAYAYLLTLWIRRSKTTGLRTSIYSTFSPTCRVRLPQHRSSNSTGKQSRQDRQTRTLFPSELAQSHSFQKVGRHSKHGQNSEGQLLGTNYRLISINQSICERRRNEKMSEWRRPVAMRTLPISSDAIEHGRHILHGVLYDERVPCIYE